MTKPRRCDGGWGERFWGLASPAAGLLGGVSGTLKRALGVYRREGLAGVKQRVGNHHQTIGE